MKNPWEEIALADYENHMKLDSVRQLQALSAMMKGQLSAYPVRRAMILGVAGGNGLEHVKESTLTCVYGVDVNAAYLQEALRRHPELEGVLQCLHVDLTTEAHRLPQAELVIANLLVEYIGYDCFQRVIRQVKPEVVSCIIQINAEGSWVSDSPYLHAFDGLNRIHHQMEEDALEKAMGQIGYRRICTLRKELPNGKKLVQLDFHS